MAHPSTKIPLEVLIHKEKNRVVFAEANADFVNIVFSFLTMPMGTIVRLLSNHSKQPVIGSFNNLYRSVVNLEAKYFASKACKDMLLYPRNSAEADCANLKINIDDIKHIEFFTCRDMSCTERRTPAYLSIYDEVSCKNCNNLLNRKAFCWDIICGVCGGKFVSPNASYVVTDDLRVIPNILASTLAILQNSGITDIGVLQKETFTIGSTEILDLLMYSILSKTPLTHMFFGKNYKFVDKPFQTVDCELATDLNDDFKKMKVTVLVQKSNNKILLAHSSEDFIEFLLSFLTIPLGRVVSHSSKDDAPGIQNIHRSVSDLNVGEYFKSQKVKDILVCPQLAMIYLCADPNYPLKKKKIPRYYWSSKYETEGIYNITTDSSSANHEGGFLNESTKFMVTDDLVVTPLSSMFCIEYLQSRKVTTSDIEEQVIEVGVEEAKNLLKASLISTSVLTNGLKHLIRAYPDTKKLVKKLKE